MEKEGTSVFLIGPYRGGDFSTGVDTAEQLDRVPDDTTGGVLTNEVELAAKVLKSGKTETDDKSLGPTRGTTR